MPASTTPRVPAQAPASAFYPLTPSQVRVILQDLPRAA